MMTDQPYDDFLDLDVSLRAHFFDDPRKLMRLQQASAEQKVGIRSVGS
jgi:hypothetical protein